MMDSANFWRVIQKQVWLETISTLLEEEPSMENTLLLCQRLKDSLN